MDMPDITEATYRFQYDKNFGGILLSFASTSGVLVAGMRFTPDEFYGFWQRATQVMNELAELSTDEDAEAEVADDSDESSDDS